MTEQLRQRPGDQPLPTAGQENVQDALIRHIEARKALGIQQIPLRNRDGEVIAHALVDQADYEKVASAGRWHLAKNGYVQRTWRENGERHHVYLHRFVMGATPADPQIDHRNRNRLDCRRSNLAYVSNAENAQNRASKPGSSSLYRGVTWDKARGKWQASARLDGKRHHLGRFDDEDQANAAIEVWRAEHMPFSSEARALVTSVADRRDLGIQRYGRPLQTFNGRNAIKDLLDELLDGATYAMQVEMEHAATQTRIREALHLHRADPYDPSLCVTCEEPSPCDTRRALLDVAEPKPEPDITVTTVHPVEEIAVHPDTLDTFKTQLKLHTVEERLQHSILPGSILGIDVVTDPSLPPGAVHMRPRNRKQ